MLGRCSAETEIMNSSSSTAGAQGSDGPQELASFLLLLIGLLLFSRNLLLLLRDLLYPPYGLSAGRWLQGCPVPVLQRTAGICERRLAGPELLRAAELPVGLAAVAPAHAGPR